MTESLKLAVLADIHGNWPALQAVVADMERWGPDMVLVNGDIINSGPCNVACWQFIRERQAQDGWVVLRGNHEDYVTAWSEPGQPVDGPAFELSQFSHWTYHQMDGQVADLGALPERWAFTAPDDTRLVAMHASLLGNRAGIYPHTSDDDARQRIDLSADVFISNHTHVPHVRRVGRTDFINTGSVGLPADGDHRAAYGRLTWSRSRGWQGHIRRVAYDMEATEQAFVESGFLAGAGPLAHLTLVELRSAYDAKTRWTALYRDAVLRGEMTVADAVAEFLDTAEFRPFLGPPLAFQGQTQALENA